MMLGLFLPEIVQADPLTFNKRLQSTLDEKTAQTYELAHLTTPDEYGTPFIIKLARQGDAKALAQLKQLPAIGTVLSTKDKYGNNLFHVAKDAKTVHAIASLIRNAEGAKAFQTISSMIDEHNDSGETALFAQINAAHDETFRSLYAYSSLRKENREVRERLNRLRGIEGNARDEAALCARIRKMASANGRTLLQAAQDQVPYNPQMAPLAQTIKDTLPCLAQ